MSFLVLPPEVNSALMFAGAGSGPTLAAAAAWDGLAAELAKRRTRFRRPPQRWPTPPGKVRRRRRWPPRQPLCQLAKHGSNTRAKRGRTGQGGRGGV